MTEQKVYGLCLTKLLGEHACKCSIYSIRIKFRKLKYQLRWKIKSADVENILPDILEHFRVWDTGGYKTCTACLDVLKPDEYTFLSRSLIVIIILNVINHLFDNLRSRLI